MTATVKLRTGAEVPVVFVTVLSLSIDRLTATAPFAVIDLVELARTGTRPEFEPSAQRLRDLHITEQDGSLHQLVRDVVLAMFDGDGLDVRRVDPIDRAAGTGVAS